MTFQSTTEHTLNRDPISLYPLMAPLSLPWFVEVLYDVHTMTKSLKGAFLKMYPGH